MIVHYDGKDFRCFRRFSVPLKPLTILIGQNDTGKSAFLAGLEILAQARAVEPLDWWRGEATARGFLRVRDDRGALTFSNGTLEPGEARSRFCPISVFRLPTASLSFSGHGVNDNAPIPELESTGSRFPALMDYFLRRDRPRFNAIVGALKQRIAGLEDINIGTPSAGDRSILVRIESGLELSHERISDGAKIIMMFVAMAFHPNLPPFLLVEEPENGVHPHRLKDIVGLLRDITKGTHSGRPTQVILTTHSPYLLDHIDLATDQVLVFRRESDGSRVVEPISQERLKPFLGEFMLGEVWFNQSEDRLVDKP